VPEWLIGAVSKTVVCLWCTVGSNPTPSAITRRANPEGCQSGRLGTPGKRVYLYGYRGFESHPLRHRLLRSRQRRRNVSEIPYSALIQS